MAVLKALLLVAAVTATAQLASAQTAAERREALSRMIPKHEGYLGALAPENLNKERPAPPFDLTGTWFVDLSRAFSDFRFGPPYPEFIGQAKEDYEYSQTLQRGQDAHQAVPVRIGLDDRQHLRARRLLAGALEVRGQRGEVDLRDERAGHGRV